MKLQPVLSRYMVVKFKEDRTLLCYWFRRPDEFVKSRLYRACARSKDVFALAIKAQGVEGSLHDGQPWENSLLAGGVIQCTAAADGGAPSRMAWLPWNGVWPCCMHRTRPGHSGTTP